MSRKNELHDRIAAIDLAIIETEDGIANHLESVQTLTAVLESWRGLRVLAVRSLSEASKEGEA